MSKAKAIESVATLEEFLDYCDTLEETGKSSKARRLAQINGVIGRTLTDAQRDLYETIWRDRFGADGRRRVWAKAKLRWLRPKYTGPFTTEL